MKKLFLSKYTSLFSALNNKLQTYKNYPDQEIIQAHHYQTHQTWQGQLKKKKKAYKFTSTPLTAAEKSLLQKGPEFVVPPSSAPWIVYITAGKHIYVSVAKNLSFGKIDCRKYYSKVKDVLSKSVAKSQPLHPNITE